MFARDARGNSADLDAPDSVCFKVRALNANVDTGTDLSKVSVLSIRQNMRSAATATTSEA
jgi:hypothetical protein